MDRYRRLVPYLLVAAVLGCSYPLVHLNLAYTKRDLSHDVLLVFPVAGHRLTINNPGDIIKSFRLSGQDPVQAVMDTLNAIVTAEVNQHLRDIRLAPPLNGDDVCVPDQCSGYFGVELTLKPQHLKHEFILPKAAYIDTLAGKVDFILVLDRVELSRRSTDRGIEPNQTKGEDQLQSLVIFALWDYNADRPVSFGSVQTLTFFTFEPAADTWHNHFKDMARNIFTQIPMHYTGE